MVPSRAWSYGLFIVVWFYCCSTLVGAKKIITDPTEVKALEAIKKSLIDSNKNLSNWDRGDPCTSNWTGVACYYVAFEDGYHHVERLQLLGMNLSGTLSPELGKLLNLRILDFMWNNISGSIPKEIGNIKTLELLILNGNNLTGPLPEELGYLSNLDRMQIDQNKISGPLPISFSNLNKTKHFHMNNNSISGQIPQEFFNLSSILHFLLDNNNLSGHLPPEFSELKKLKILQLDNNNFGGTSIPKSYSKMSQLLKLSLKNCNLQGPIPDLSQMSYLYYIDLSSNYLNGSIPQSIVSQNITTIDFSNNSLSGTIPSYFSELRGLQRLSLANNSLSGSVASIIWQNKSLSATERLEVDLQNNNLSDVVGSFYLHQNVSIWLQGNPFCFNNNLVQFCGNISNTEDSSSGSPNASSTCLACYTPSEYNPTIPDDCFCAAPLIVGFRWKSPGFSRFLPYRSGFEKFLTEKGLNISVNQLYIENFGWEAEHRLRMTLKIFPPYVVDDKNSHFFNNSEIQRIINVFATMSFPSNDLFGPSDLISLSTNYNDMTQGSPSSLSKGSLVGIILGTIAASVTLSAVISLLLMRAHMIKNHAVSTRLPSSRAQMRIDGVKAFTYEEMALATNNFNNSTQIGEGGYGKVYKGILADGIVVAIKRAREGSLQGENEFFTEIELLSRSRFSDEIGEIYVEDRSSFSAWRTMSKKFITACSEICKQKGSLKLCCRHLENEKDKSNCHLMTDKNKVGLASLAKFCRPSGSVSVPSVFEADNELDMSFEVLKKWLEQDRFGLDVEFVQEIIEQLPGVRTCSRYEFVGRRVNHSTAPMVGNGLLMVKLNAGVDCKKEALYGLVRRSKKAKLIKEHIIYEPPPPGKPLCLRVPPDYVGDVYQAWELLWRFHGILNLEEPLSLEELEGELINPWSDGASLLERSEKEILGSQDVCSHRVDCTGVSVFSQSAESGQATDRENPHAFIQMKTGATKEAVQAKLASFTYSRCCGVALTKAHKSLLRGLISELQSKVAALVDPNYDSGESKSKRGRKKDVDSCVPAKRTKINILPINELTWPELARRYMLAVLSMDGNLDSAEVIARESSKVFRCLQGDGGVLCGSLTGVAGMEADALLLAESTKQLFGSLNRDNDVLTIEDNGSDAASNGASEKDFVNDGNIPEWAKMLEPARKLPTNVGTRIRKCVYDALEKGPPEWAKKILEHSISKEVYKGNASGPTKKAVLSVLADVCGDKVQQKTVKGIKKKTVISVSDIIMKRCRIVLRCAAAADDAKVFCNLLGRKPINSSDNDDEGFLGTQAMVSRPLDFRTIDLRLATGAYGGSQEAFLEDVRELWNIVRTAYGDQPELIELAESLSQNFESLYEKEVATVVHKFGEYSKLETFSAETRKEIDEFLASSNEIPKAPWDEGVCKVCGIDRDDDSVLLCDTCDAEYHTYCLNPPLARIPEGNWYCPSCIVGKRVSQDASEQIQFVGRRQSKRYQGEVTRVFLEALTHLSSVMEEKEYWDLNLGERTFLLKFLCDELLNSALIRQHLEQCAESSAELQQKLRSLSVELKNLKAKEENLAARATKVDTSMLAVVGEVSGKEVANMLANPGNCVGQRHTVTASHNNSGVYSNELPHIEGGQEGSGLDVSDKLPSVTSSENNTQVMNPLDTEVQLKDVHGVLDDRKVNGDLCSQMASQETDKSCGPNGLPVSHPLSQEYDVSVREIHPQDNLQEYKVRDVCLPSSDQQGHCTSNMVSHHAAQNASAAGNEPQTYQLELNSVKNDIALLQDSVARVESQLLKLSVRREFLGSDSVGRLYWASATPSKDPWVIVCGGAVQHERKKMYHEGTVDKISVLRNSTSSINTHSNLEGSRACCPTLYEVNDATGQCSSWVCYETGAEIDELVSWLKDSDPKERELKESIIHWHKQRFQDDNHGQDEHQLVLSLTRSSEAAGSSNSLVTRAAMLLERKYGPCEELETVEILKKRGKKARVANDEKMYRCECLEPIWPSRHHCLSCHRTFSTDVELEGHNDGRCSSGALAFEKSKETNDTKKSKRNSKCEIVREECIGDIDALEISKGGVSQFSSRLIKYQNEGMICPYDLDEICSKFVTEDSNKELVQEIGLIGSNGIPSFVPSMSPYRSDSTMLLLNPKKDVSGPGDEPRAVERPVSHGNTSLTMAAHNITCNSSPRSAANEIIEALKPNKPALGCSEKREKKSSIDGHSLEMGAGRCCVVPMSSLRPIVGDASQISRRLKINLLDMDAALPEEAVRPSKSHMERRWAWRSFVKSAGTIYEMVQATIILEDMIKTEYLRNEWWYWSSLSAAAKTSTLSALALRIYSLDAAIIYEVSSNLDQPDNLEPSSTPEPRPLPSLDLAEKSKVTRKSSKKRKEPEG